MTDDLPFYAPGAHASTPPRVAKPGEEVWRLQNDEGWIVTCELRNDARAGLGWDVQLLEDGELVFSRRCPVEAGARFTTECFRQGLCARGIHRLDPHRHQSRPRLKTRNARKSATSSRAARRWDFRRSIYR
jgi:hypothetical protein